MKLKERYHIILMIRLYGGHILEAMMLDHILENLKLKGMIGYTFEHIPTKTDKDLRQNLDYLVLEGYINEYSNNSYDITQKGRLHLASGGFTTAAKTTKNSLYAFRISVVSIIIAIMGFLLGVFNWFTDAT